MMEKEIWYVDTMTSLTSILLNCTHSLLYDIPLFCHPPFSKTLHLLHQTKHYSTLISSVYVFIKVAASKAAFIKHTVNIFFLSVCLFSFNRYVQPWSLNRWGKIFFWFTVMSHMMVLSLFFWKMEILKTAFPEGHKNHETENMDFVWQHDESE